MSCACGGGAGCAGGLGPYRSPITQWSPAPSTTDRVAVSSAGPGQPGRAPAAAREVPAPWWAWLLIALLALQLVKKGGG